MRVALIHYWLIGMRGGEKVLEALCRMYPDADIFTLFYDPERVSPLIRSHRVIASWLNPARRFHRSLLPLMPFALESLDLRDYDLVISSEAGPAKGVMVNADARHVCYVHSPMRYLWELYPEHLQQASLWKRPLMAAFATPLRLWDQATAGRVDDFAANSESTQRRIKRAWNRDAEVAYPPVAVDTFYSEEPRDYLLAVGELVPYKRLDYCIAACRSRGLKLKIVGDGPEYSRLKALAGAETEFCGRVPDGDLRRLFAQCRAYVIPGEEDFGISTVEALASGKPVVGLARGGTVEVLGGQPLGILYKRATEEALLEALSMLNAFAGQLDTAQFQARAGHFSEAEFVRRMHCIIGPAKNLEIPALTHQFQ